MPASAPAESTAHPRARRWSGWIPLALAIIAFIAYWPSLKSDFVYDGRIEILDEGFVTNLSNLPAVLSLKVLGMHTMLGPRPGDILYLMLIAAACGTHPFGFHLGSNLLHAANVALLFILLRRLAQAETTLYRENAGKIQWAIAVITLLFALHPISVETVAEVSYSADLLVVFFTLLALLAATAFRPGIPYRCLLASAAGILCSFASVISKESGIATAFILMAYWFLYRRGEAKMPWLLFLGGAVLVSGSFLFALSVSGAPELVNRGHTDYLGGSFLAVFWVQPRLWVFMMGQLLWPTRLSGLYTLENLGGLSSIMAVIVLAAVVSLQARLACKSRLGALGMAVYWSGLALVSNFIPLFLPLADRFYYLPLVGVAMQLVALLLLLLRWHWLFWGAVALVVCAIPSLACLTVVRQAVFATELAFWSDTVKASPGSATSHDNLGNALALAGRLDEAVVQFRKAVELDPAFANAHDNLANAFSQQGRSTEAINEYRKAIELNPDSAFYHYNLGWVFLQGKRPAEAIPQFQAALQLKPDYVQARDDLTQAEKMLQPKPNPK